MANKHAVYDPNHTPDQSRNDSNPEFADFKRSQSDSPSSINVPTIHIPDSGSHSDLDAIFASKMRLEQTSSAGINENIVLFFPRSTCACNGISGENNARVEWGYVDTKY